MASSRSYLGTLTLTALAFSAGYCARPLVRPLQNAPVRNCTPPIAFDLFGARNPLEQAVCAYEALPDSVQQALGLRAVSDHPNIIGTYARNVGKDAWSRIESKIEEKR